MRNVWWIPVAMVLGCTSGGVRRLPPSPGEPPACVWVGSKPAVACDARCVVCFQEPHSNNRGSPGVRCARFDPRDCRPVKGGE